MPSLRDILNAQKAKRQIPPDTPSEGLYSQDGIPVPKDQEGVIIDLLDPAQTGGTEHWLLQGKGTSTPAPPACVHTRIGMAGQWEAQDLPTLAEARAWVLDHPGRAPVPATIAPHPVPRPHLISRA
jgi:hypothetical protein